MKTPFLVGESAWLPPSKEYLRPNIKMFTKLRQAFPNIEFYYPNKEVAPWHIQAKVNETVINFWPHFAKGGFSGDKSVTGRDALMALLEQAELAEEVALLEDMK